MLERMEKVYTDLSYIDESYVQRVESEVEKVNINAASLVIICINKMYQLMLNYGF